MSDPFFLELFAGVGEAARERGCDVILVSHIAPANFEDLSVAMTTSRAEGVIFLGQSSLHAAFNRLSETERALRGLGRAAARPELLLGGLRQRRWADAERRFTWQRLGRKRIVFLGDTEAPEAMQRHRGYLDALEHAEAQHRSRS